MKLRSLHNRPKLDFYFPGSNKVKFAAQSLGRQWKMKQDKTFTLLQH
jgi:hypothetical protein